jgi:hypothetical protein
MEKIGQSGVAAKLGDQSRDVVAALPAASRALDPQHIEAADQTADRTIERHGVRLVGGRQPSPLVARPYSTQVLAQ